MASSLTELWKWLECTVMLRVCLYVPSTCLPWMSLLKSRPFYFFPFVRFIPLFSLVSGPTLEVTYALLLAFDSSLTESFVNIPHLSKWHSLFSSLFFSLSHPPHSIQVPVLLILLLIHTLKDTSSFIPFCLDDCGSLWLAFFFVLLLSNQSDVFIVHFWYVYI